MKFLFLILIAFVFAFPAYASIVISEIMYDVEGSDTGREWVEIQNIGADADLTGWKLFESGVNHGLVLAKGNILLPQNGFAIIADNIDKFLLDWPDFSGTIFDSSFSLSNSGETVILRDAGLGDSDTVVYSSDFGANGDGNSLQKVGNSWVSNSPTLGAGVESENNSPSPSEGGGIEGGGSEELGGGGSIPEPKSSPFQAFAGKDRFALAGAEVYFDGHADGISEDLISKARFLWNFGDGAIGEGKNIKHIFQYPGNYIVNLNVSFGAFSSSDSAKVAVSPAGISISEIKPGTFLEIENSAGKISDVSGFGIQINDSKIFSFPKDSMLSHNSFLALDVSALGFEIPSAGEVKILYPNGKILFSSKYQSGVLSQNESLNFDGKLWQKGASTPGEKNTPSIPPTKQVGGSAPPYKGGETKEFPLLNKEGYGEVRGEASAINSIQNNSFWSEIKWLIFGLGGGVLLGFLYFFFKRHLKPVSAL
ncbi:MAG: lamin tail domain-containing protein [Patescibacteria group bacterium]